MGKIKYNKYISKKKLYNLYYKENLSLSETAKRLNISSWKVFDLMDTYKIERRKASTWVKYKNINKKMVVKTYNASLNLSEAAKKLNISKGCFRRYMKKFKINVRTKKETFQKRSKIQGYKIQEMYNNGKSVREIAKQLNISWPKVYRIMNLFDISRKDLNQKGCKRKKSNRNGKNNTNWKGGVIYNQGRKLIYCPNHPCPDFHNKYVYNYRLVMEKCLGKYLKKCEVVHHINKDITDDRIENLYVCKNQSEHARIHKENKND